MVIKNSSGRITAEARQLIVNSYKSGSSTITIAKQFGVSDCHISRIIKNSGTEIRHKNKTYSDEEKALISEAYASGDSMAVVMAKFGVSGKALSRFLKQTNTPIRSPKNVIEGKEDDVIALYAEGKTVQEVARQFDLQGHHIFYFLKARGLTRNSGVANRMTWQKADVNKKRLDKLKKRNQSQRGLNAPNWKGGKTSVSKAIRTSLRYRQWRTDIFERDNYTCQHCSRTSRELPSSSLQADHKYPFSALLHDYQIKSLDQALGCVELWDVSNGRTLCKACHEQTDTYQNGAKKYVKCDE